GGRRRLRHLAVCRHDARAIRLGLLFSFLWRLRSRSLDSTAGRRWIVRAQASPRVEQPHRERGCGKNERANHRVLAPAGLRSASLDTFARWCAQTWPKPGGYRAVSSRSFPQIENLNLQAIAGLVLSQIVQLHRPIGILLDKLREVPGQQ